MPDFGIGELIAALATTAAAAAPEAAAAAAPEALAAGAEFAAPAALEAAGLPFAAGVGELGSVATGIGPLGVSAFGDTAALSAAGLGTAGALSGELASAGLPAAAGVGQIGAVSGPGSVADAILGTGALAGTGADITGLGGVAAAPVTPVPTGPGAAGGVTTVGPTAGTPASPLSGSFGAPGATTSAAPAAPGAVAPVGSAGNAATDLTSAASTAGKTASTTASGTSFLDKIVDGATKNAIPGAIGAAGLGYSLLKGNQPPAGTNNLNAIAPGALAAGANAVNSGQQLTNYLPTGTLPPDQQSALDNATNSAKKTILSNYAQKGLPTDPSKNSSLATELAQVDRQALTTKAQIEGQLSSSGSQLINTGLSATGLSSNIYNQLVGIDQTQQKQISDAIASFAKALGGTGSGGLSLKLA